MIISIGSWLDLGRWERELQAWVCLLVQVEFQDDDVGDDYIEVKANE